MAQVLDQAGRIDLLVNNAGVGLVAGAEESSVEQAARHGVAALRYIIQPSMPE